MGKRRGLLGLVGLALAVTLIAAACGSGKKTTTGGTTSGATKGGVLRLAQTDFGFTNAFDPTGEYLASAITLYGALTRELISYKHVADAAGNKLYPDLATDLGQVSSDGLTYTFKLKSGVKFGPPLNRAITSKDVEYAFERINLKSLAAQYGFYYFGVIKGMDGKATSLKPISGIETPDDSTIIFHLTQATGDSLYRLSMPATAPVPHEVGDCFTKAGDYGRFVISSGPYMIQGSDKLVTSSCSAMKPISGFDLTKKMVLVRNPNYSQSTDDLRLNYPDAIVDDIDTNQDDIFSKVQAGSLDASFTDQPPKTVLQQYLTNPSKKALLHSNSGDRTWYITLNWATPPFDDLHVRKAVNYIIDKAAIQQAWGGSTLGDIATHIIPPIVLNGQLDASYDPYGSPGEHGDEAKAKAEIQQSKYDSNHDGTCDASACKNLVMINRTIAPWTNSEPIVVQDLAKIGIQVKPRELTSSNAYTTIQTVKNMIPIALNAGWGKDYADPLTFMLPLFDGSSIIPSGNTNYALVGLTSKIAGGLGIKIPSGVTVPNVDSDISACSKLAATDANRVTCWANLDKKLMETAAPWVPYLWAKNQTVTATSVTHWEFDQFSGYLSITNVAVNNNLNVSSIS